MACFFPSTKPSRSFCGISSHNFPMVRPDICFLDAPATPPKTNMEPKNEGLEDDVPFLRDDFQVPAVFGGGGG